ncbi:hypothetical protein CISG_09642 [Coccidioides immitis RMSCC 3703]|uniref:Uncharacterized protein n=1 Tax=Coccidioides immitis RMSCC 3703 TaxID=454286 RepID=A0A0J8U5C1_COCIT|nr:hypothetical protein CISG_09642 [Coccidioides immitis RMSCC 3703]
MSMEVSFLGPKGTGKCGVTKECLASNPFPGLDSVWSSPGLPFYQACTGENPVISSTFTHLISSAQPHPLFNPAMQSRIRLDCLLPHLQTRMDSIQRNLLPLTTNILESTPYRRSTIRLAALLPTGQ